MSSKTADEINDQILAYAKDCLSAANPEHCVRNRAQALIGEGWAQEDISEVVRGALKVIEHLRDKKQR